MLRIATATWCSTVSRCQLTQLNEGQTRGMKKLAVHFQAMARLAMNRRYFRFLDSSDRPLFNCTVNLLFNCRQRRKYFVETLRFCNEHIPHRLVVAPQPGQSF